MDVCSCDKDSKIMEGPPIYKKHIYSNDNGDFFNKRFLEYIKL
jgi:hypothetical protein